MIRNNWIYRSVFLAGWLMAAELAFAQKAEVVIAPDSILIGQQASLEMIIELPEEAMLVWPGISDTITAEIEIVRFGSPETIQQSGGNSVYRQTHIVTAWEEGFWAIPPIQFKSVKGTDTLVFFSEPLLLAVHAPEVDQEAGLRDIKTIFGIPLTIRDILPWALGMILIALLVWALSRYLKKRRRSSSVQTIWEKPEIPAHIAAISSLEKLKSQKLWQQGRNKPYHSFLTDILRMYLAKRFGLHAQEMTTSEIVVHVPSYIENDQAIADLRRILELADLVKFARYKPESQANEQSMELAFGFVEATKVKEKNAD